jgi:hypothetical protein
MSDQATSTPPIFPGRSYVELMGRSVMDLKSRRNLILIDGDRRRFGDRSPGTATLRSIPGGKEKPK